MALQTQIKISYLPGFEPYAGYTNSIYTCNKVYEKPAKGAIIRTSEEWSDNRFIGSDKVAIQGKLEQRFEVMFTTTESIATELIEMAGIVEIKEANKDWYKAYKISANKEYKKEVNIYVNTIQYSKHNEKEYFDYLASEHVKAWGDLSSSNYINYINFTAESVAYTQRAEGVNGTIATLDYNFKFELNTETSQIIVTDKFYAIINGKQIRSSPTSDQDYRCSVVYIDSDYIYFKMDTIPIVVFTETEITVQSEPFGEDEISVPTANEFNGKIYTFLKTKKTTDFEAKDTFEQYPGIIENSELQFYRQRRCLLYIKPDEIYLYEKLMMSRVENVYFSEFDYQGNETKYYPVSMNQFALKQKKDTLKDLIEIEMVLIYNNQPINVNRPTV